METKPEYQTERKEPPNLHKAECCRYCVHAHIELDDDLEPYLVCGAFHETVWHEAVCDTWSKNG